MARSREAVLRSGLRDSGTRRERRAIPALQTKKNAYPLLPHWRLRGERKIFDFQGRERVEVLVLTLSLAKLGGGQLCWSMSMDWENWISQAWVVRDRAYAPYSKFQVGALLVASDGRIFTGCNVENLSYGLTLCAERVAVGSAVAAGAKEIIAAVVVADTQSPISPCGACRQVLAEFGDPRVLLVNRESWAEFQLSELLPRASTGILEKPPTGGPSAE